MMKRCRNLVAISFLLLACASLATAGDEPGKSTRLETGKVVEAETSVKLAEPNFGYEGHLGCFVATTNGDARCLIVVHHYPETKKMSLGNTKLAYEGTRRLGNVNGYVFKTEWDGQKYPSKVFLSSESIYFGGGINAYVAADYRSGTGWAWKLLPLRRMDVVSDTKTVSGQ